MQNDKNLNPHQKSEITQIENRLSKKFKKLFNFLGASKNELVLIDFMLNEKLIILFI